MEIPFILIKIPSYSEVYIFGSILTTLNANDLDLLVIYDNNACYPINAYTNHKILCEELEIAFRLPVHLTLLTHNEAQQTQFIERTHAVPFADALKIINQCS